MVFACLEAACINSYLVFSMSGNHFYVVLACLGDTLHGSFLLLSCIVSNRIDYSSYRIVLYRIGKSDQYCITLVTGRPWVKGP